MSSTLIGAFQNLAYKLSCLLPGSDGAFTSSSEQQLESHRDRVTLGQSESWAPRRPDFRIAACSPRGDIVAAASATQDRQLALGAASVITGVPLFDWPK